MPINRLLRWTVATTVAASLLATAGPAASAAGATRHPVTTRLAVRAAPATVLAGALVVLSGTVTPRVTGAQVSVERLVGKTWRTLSKHTVSAAGAVAVSVRAPRTTGAWVLRVTRAASTTAKAGTSGLLQIRVVSKAFVVKAAAALLPVTVGTPSVVTGSVSRHGTGSVWLQQLVGKVWHNVASAKLTSHATFSVKTRLTVGAHKLRVTKGFTATIAGGVSKSFSLTVLAVPSPVVTTASLMAATALRPYNAALTATSGTPPYTWTATGLPAGLTVSAAGAISGTPTVAGTSTLTVTVRDTGGRTGSATLSLVVSRTSCTAWAWGANDAGELGNGTLTNAIVPGAVTGLTGVVQIVGAGSSGGYALRADGTVAAWGGNNFGALGNGTVVASTTPVAVSGLTGVTAVAAGIYVGLALKADGTVWAWGYGANDQIGNGSTADSDVPAQVSNLTGVTAIASNGADSFALKSDGTVWSWGSGMNGALGNGTTVSSDVPVQVTGLSGVVALAGSQESGYALKGDGTVWAWGWNGYGQLGDNTTINRSTAVQVQGLTTVTAISGGFYAGLALKADGTVWDWGLGQHGALGNNAVVNSSIPVAVSGLATVTAIAGGGQSGYATKADGTEWAWGSGGAGQLGNATTTDSSIPVAVSVLRGIFAISGGNADGYAINLG
jgi:alpha-tubulin suppressor-like RCC1 family protein